MANTRKRSNGGAIVHIDLTIDDESASGSSACSVIDLTGDDEEGRTYAKLVSQKPRAVRSTTLCVVCSLRGNHYNTGCYKYQLGLYRADREAFNEAKQRAEEEYNNLYTQKRRKLYATRMSELLVYEPEPPETFKRALYRIEMMQFIEDTKGTSKPGTIY